MENENIVNQKKEQKTLNDYFTSNYDQQMNNLDKGIANLKKDVSKSVDIRTNLLKDIEKLKN